MRTNRQVLALFSRLQRVVLRLECEGFIIQANVIRYAWLDWLDRQFAK